MSCIVSLLSSSPARQNVGMTRSHSDWLPLTTHYTNLFSLLTPHYFSVVLPVACQAIVEYIYGASHLFTQPRSVSLSHFLPTYPTVSLKSPITGKPSGSLFEQCSGPLPHQLCFSFTQFGFPSNTQRVPRTRGLMPTNWDSSRC